MDRSAVKAMLIVDRQRGREYARHSALDDVADVIWIDNSQDRSDEEVERDIDAHLADVDILVGGAWVQRMPRFTPERFAAAKRLTVIAGTFDNRFGHWIDVADANRRGITVIDTSRTMTPTVAEFALAMTLNVIRDISTAIALVRGGGWQTEHWDQPGFVHGDLGGRRIGLAGFGVINRRYAELIAPFHCDVRTCDPFVTDDVLEAHGVGRLLTLPELAALSDIFVIGIPPTPATMGIIDASVIDALPAGATLILVTRMAVVDQESLWRRTQAGQIRAAIDVFDPEPPPADAWFRTSPYVFPTPHIAGNTSDCHRRCFTIAVEEGLRHLAGEQARFVVTPHDDRLYRGVAKPLV